MITKKHIRDLKHKIDDGFSPSFHGKLWQAYNELTNPNQKRWRPFDPDTYLNKALIFMGLSDHKGRKTHLALNYDMNVGKKNPLRRTPYQDN